MSLPNEFANYRLRSSERAIYFVVVPLLLSATLFVTWIAPITAPAKVVIGGLSIVLAAYTALAYWLRTRKRWSGLRYTTPVVTITVITIGLAAVGAQSPLGFILYFPAVMVASIRYGRSIGIGTSVLASAGYFVALLLTRALTPDDLTATLFVSATLIIVAILSGAMVDEERQLKKQAQERHAREQAALLKLADALVNTSDMQVTFATVLNIVIEVLSADAAAITMRSDGGDEILAANGNLAAYAGRRLPSEEATLVDLAIVTGQPAWVNDFQQERRIRRWPPGQEHNLRAALAVPMIREGAAQGVLTVHRRRPRDFTPDDIHLLSVFANQTLVAVEWVRAEEALRASEQHFRTLVNSIDDAVFTLDRNLRVVGVFGRWLEKRGELPEKYLGKTAKEIFEPRLAAIYEAADRRALAGETVTYEWFTEGDNGVQYFHTSLSPMRDANGEVTGIVGVARDITERKQHEVEIRLEAARAQTLARMAARLNAELNLETALKTVCEETAQAMNVSIASISLYDAKLDALRLAYGVGLPGEYRERAQPVPRAAYEKFLNPSSPIVVMPNVQTLTGFPNADLDAELNVRTTVSVSMNRQGKLIGRLNISTLNDGRRFSEEELALLAGLADQAAQAIANARLFESEYEQRALAEAVRDSAAVINSSLNLDEVLDQILTNVGRVVPHDSASIMLIASDVARVARRRGYAEQGQEEAVLNVRFKVADVLCLRQMRQTGEPMTVPDTNNFPGWVNLAETRWVRSYAGAPIMRKGRVIGFLNLNSRTPGFFTPTHAQHLLTFANQAGIAIENAQLFNDIQLSNADLVLAYLATLEGWSRALELRDQETEGHTQRVTDMTLRLARAFGLSQEEIIQIYRGALMHDIGKMGIPDSILLKPGPLSEEETTIMRRHPTYAYELLSPIEYLRPALDIPYCHHEKWDGRGYPRGLKGEEIPFAARIFAVADVWDALRSDRPYRRGWPDDKVREHIANLSGTHFEPKVVDMFLKLLDQE